jgi:hypothetical protein
MTQIKEGNLTFTFPQGWEVLKYDDSAFYRFTLERTGAELSAVDLLVKPQNKPAHLLLIEVKDFRGHAVENRKRQSSGDLVKEVIRKAIDTLSGLYIAARVGKTDLEPLCQMLLRLPLSLELVLFMEEDPVPVPKKTKRKNKLSALNHLTGRQNMDWDLRSKLKNSLNIHARVLNKSTLKPRDRWTAA